MSDDLAKMCWRLSKYVHAQLSGIDLERIANRIERLEAELITAEQRGYANAMEAERKLHEERIEELEAKLREMALDCLAADGQAAEAYQAQLAAEAKLAKAVGALEVVLNACYEGRMIPRPGHGAGGMTIEANIKGSIYTGVPAWPIEEACTTLAELKGETDE
jgi:septal ring factor EnvC (AmiA/AmiB activator)